MKYNLLPNYLLCCNFNYVLLAVLQVEEQLRKDTSVFV